MKAIQRFCFPERNQIFIAFTMLLFLMTYLIIKYSDAPLLLPEKWFGFLLCDPAADKTLYNIAISYAAAYIFYIIQVFIPTVNKEKRAWLIIRRPLSALVRGIKEVLYVIDHMVEFNDGGIAEISASSWYYKTEYLDQYPQPIDNTPSHQLINGKHLRKANSSCKNVPDLCKKLNELKKRAQKLMDMQALANLDPHIVELLINLAPVQFCEESANTIHVLNQLQPLRAALSAAHVTAKVQRVQELIKDIPGFRIDQKENHYRITGPNNIKIEIPGDTYNQLPLRSNFLVSINKVKETLTAIELYNDLDGHIVFHEMDEEEIKQHREYSRIMDQAAKQVF